jgi:predicted aldo/keto reductase-like oxidoreductase
MGIKNDLGRRGFLKSTVLGAAGAIAGVTAYGRTNQSVVKEPVFIRRKLGHTDIELPIVSFGVMRSDNAGLIRSALDMGFVHFDTAHGYQEGRNETMLGEIFKERPRSSFILATKVAPDDVDRQTGELGPGTTRESILAKFELSLSRLQLSYVDILYFHAISNRNAALAPQVLDAFSELKKQGKVRYFGLSTHQNEPDVIQAAIDSNFYNVVLTAINFKHQSAALIKEKAALAAQKGIGIVAMKTMAGGFLDKERTQPVNCSAALKWVLQDPNISTSIPGIVNYDQLNQNFSVMESLELTEKEKADLQEAGLVSGLYCDNCSQCLHQCKKHLPVHEIMRAYMYTYGYRHYENALTVLDKHQIAVNPCGDCGECTVNCPKGFVVADRIADVSRLSMMPREFLV